jgi:opacity protein-like surface antigen
MNRWIVTLATALAMPVAAAERDCYVGVQGGGAVGASRHHNATNGPITDDFAISGGALGANAGCLWKANRNGYGLEADFSALRVKGSESDEAPFFNPAFTSETHVERLATLRGVMGYEPAPRWFAYGTAGLATATGRASACAPDGTCIADEKRLCGLAGGIGAEYAMSQNLRLRFEYLSVGFAKKKFLESAPAPFSDRGGGVEADLHLFRAGVTLHF